VPLALSTGHMVGLAVTAAVFIAFALASSFLFPRFRPQFPGVGLPAFIVVSFVFFFGMLTAVEVFGAESGHAEGAAETQTGGESPTTSVAQPTTTQQQTTTTTSQQQTSTAKTTTAQAPAQTVQVSEVEFKINLSTTSLKAGQVTFDVKNDGHIAHDFAIKGGSKTPLIQPGASAKLTTTLKAGKIHFYCSVPGHEAAGMKVDVTVS
jgi:uncharacterized cupredoxin-like copper-binding protein